MMYLDEDLVKSDCFVKGYTGDMYEELRKKARTQGYHTISKSGVIGDQTRASREKGIIYYSTLKKIILGYIKNELDS
jgi:hypothetical protein